MKISTHYLIRPKPELLDRLHLVSSSDDRVVLAKPHLIEHSEGGRTAWGEDDHTVLVKLLWVANVRGSPCLESNEDAASVLKDPSISTATFDRWWTIERFVARNSTEDMAEAVPYQKRNIAETGNPLVDEWMARASDA